MLYGITGPDCLWVRYSCASPYHVYAILTSAIFLSYPASIIGTTLGEPSFLIYFGILDPVELVVTAKGNQLIGVRLSVVQPLQYKADDNVRPCPESFRYADCNAHNTFATLTAYRRVHSSAYCSHRGLWTDMVARPA